MRLAFICVLVFAPSLFAVAPFARLTAEQRVLFRQRNTLVQRVNQWCKEGKIDEAEKTCRLVLALELRLVGPSHFALASTLRSLGLIRATQGAGKEGANLLERRASILGRLYGLEDHRAVNARWEAIDMTNRVSWDAGQKAKLARAIRLNSEVVRLYRQRQHGRALLLAREALELRREVLGERHPLYALSLNNLAAQYGAMGEHRLALPLFQKALKIRKEVLGEKHPDYATSLDELAGLYKDRGEYRQALPLYQEALKITKEVLGEKHPDHAQSLNNLAVLYRNMWEDRLALTLYQEALKITKEVLGEKHPDHATSLNNLAGHYKAMGEHRQALTLYQEALKIRKEVLGEKHPHYASSLNNLANLYHAMGEHRLALTLFLQALEIRKKVLGDKHPDYANSLINLAGLCKDRGKHRLALTLYQQGLKIDREVLGEMHPHYANSLINLGNLYLAMGDRARAVPLSARGLAMTRGYLGETASVQSERQQLDAERMVRYQLDVFLSCTTGIEVPASVVHAVVLEVKGSVLSRQTAQRLLFDSSDETTQKLLRDLQAVSRELARLALASGDPPQAKARGKRMEALTRHKDELESALSQRSEAFRQQRQRLTSRQLRDSLPDGLALVDYHLYTHRDPQAKEPRDRWRKRLVAFVLRAGQPVVHVDLGRADDLDALVTAWRGSLTGHPSGPDHPGVKLRERIWQPLEKHLAGAKVVLISPDGTLGRLAFAALPGRKAGTYLLEDVALSVVPVPRLLPQMLAPLKNETRLPPSLLVVGNVDFDRSEAVVASADDRSAPRGKLKGWSRLPGTQAEAAAVKDSFSRLFRSGRVTDLREEEARKGSVREALGKHRYAHLATHGFFAPAELKSALDSAPEREAGLFGKSGVTGWHPLLLSGIVLAGANRESKPGEEDGILTALEVSGLDLRRLELVVLSACETGLGREAAGEGLLGLQRAFAAAGARSVVSSLWKVDDRATQELMGHFYRVYWDRKTVVSRVEALRQAQLAMLREGVKRGIERDAKKVVGTRLPPYYWAAFVLSGDWR